MSSIKDIIQKKRSQKELDQEEIEAIVKFAIQKDNKVDSYKNAAQIGALLTVLYYEKINMTELGFLTKAMARSGHTFTWPEEWKHLVVDKHSSGGVGDKISHILVPCLMACGLKVPMVSGRSLGFTGGTLDKLESLPGFRVNCTTDELSAWVAESGGCIVSQSEQINPADKILYELRDLTSNVDNLNLITASIVSKKVAEGLSSLVYDVKCGNGAFCETLDVAKKLANMLVSISQANGIKTVAFITDMNNPLGKMIGNSLEMEEVIESLKGNVSYDIQELTENLGGELLHLSNKVPSMKEGIQQIRRVLFNGKAMEMFKRLIIQQGVTPEDAGLLCEDYKGNAQHKTKFVTDVPYLKDDGTVKRIKSKNLGLVWREEFDKDLTKVNFGAGLELLRRKAEPIKKGDAWVRVYHDTPLSDRQKKLLDQALEVECSMDEVDTLKTSVILVKVESHQ